MNIVGLTGYAQHGKNTVGDVLVGMGFTQLAFADTLKSMALVLNPSIVTMKDDDSGWWDVRLAWLVDELGWEGAKQNPEVRRFLQVLGTEAVRDHLGNDTWVNALRLKIAGQPQPQSFVITDVRFPNEAQAIKDWGGELWRIERPGFDNGLGTDHPSEQYIASLPTDLTLLNKDLAVLRASIPGIARAQGLV